MTARRPGFGRSLALATGAHLLVIGILVGAPLVPGCAHAPRATNLPVELIVEVPPELAAPRPAAPAPPPPPPVRDLAEPASGPRPVKPPPAETEAPKPVRTIETSRQLVRRPPPARRTTLTPDEIRRLLERGAKPGARATLSDAEMRKLLDTDLRFAAQGTPATRELLYLELIRQTLYKAWNQPASVDVSGRTAKVETRFLMDGRIVGYRLVRSSGNPAMDASVLAAMGAVGRIAGLSPEFLAAHPTITVAFELRERE
jgi:TonB family protein